MCTTARVSQLGDQHALARRDKNVLWDGLSNTRGAKIYRRAILDRRLLVARKRHKLLFPKLIAGELCATLHEIADCGRPEASQERGRALLRDDEATARKQAVARKRRVYLDARLNDI